MIPMMSKKKGKFASMLMDSMSKNSSNSGDEVEEHGYGLEAAMNKFIVGVQSGDAKKAAEAFSDAFQICEMQPHEEFEG